MRRPAAQTPRTLFISRSPATRRAHCRATSAGFVEPLRVVLLCRLWCRVVMDDLAAPAPEPLRFLPRRLGPVRRASASVREDDDGVLRVVWEADLYAGDTPCGLGVTLLFLDDAGAPLGSVHAPPASARAEEVVTVRGNEPAATVLRRATRIEPFLLRRRQREVQVAATTHPEDTDTVRLVVQTTIPTPGAAEAALDLLWQTAEGGPAAQHKLATGPLAPGPQVHTFQIPAPPPSSDPLTPHVVLIASTDTWETPEAAAPVAWTPPTPPRGPAPVEREPSSPTAFDLLDAGDLDAALAALRTDGTDAAGRQRIGALVAGPEPDRIVLGLRLAVAIGYEKMALSLRGLLQHPEPAVRSGAAEALGALGGPSLLPALRVAGYDPDPDVAAAAQAATQALRARFL